MISTNNVNLYKKCKSLRNLCFQINKDLITKILVGTID